MRYYLGSASQGSLLILLAQTIKQCLGLIKRLLKNRVVIFDNHLQKSFIRLLEVDNFLASISKNAYIEIGNNLVLASIWEKYLNVRFLALYGESYYKAGANAYKSLNGFGIENIETTSRFVLLLGKLLIALIAVVLSTPFFQVSNLRKSVDEYNYTKCFLCLIVGKRRYTACLGFNIILRLLCIFTFLLFLVNLWGKCNLINNLIRFSILNNTLHISYWIKTYQWRNTAVVNLEKNLKLIQICLPSNESLLSWNKICLNRIHIQQLTEISQPSSKVHPVL